MNFIDIAEEYIMEGFNPIPLLKNKAPKLPKGHNFLYDKINNVEQRFNNCDKIGIVCGIVSGGFYGIDFDCHDGENLSDIINEFLNNDFIKFLIDNKKTTCFKTPSGGYHFYIRIEKELKPGILSKWETNKTMIEFRATGQYLCLFPSDGYIKIKGCDITEVDFIDDDDYFNLIQYCKTFDKGEPEKIKNNKNLTEEKREWKGVWDDNTPDGVFNNKQGESVAKELLIDFGWQYIETRKDNVELWTRPGKNIEDGISATWGARKKMFYVFTDNAHPFEKNTAYSPFNIYTILKFNGDWKKAKDSLRPKINIIEEEEEKELPINEFPIDVFPKFFQEYILELKRTLNFHIDFSSAGLMFAFSTLIGNKYKLKVKNGWEATPIFWFACVGYPGTIKTHPIKTMLKPLSIIDKKSKKKYDLDLHDYNKEKDLNPNTPLNKPLFKQLLISDYTVEALHAIHNINKRGIGLYKDELKGFLNDMNKYRKGSDEEFWLESFNNGSYIVNRVTKEPIMVDNICINIIGTIQHDVLNKVIGDYKGNGLIDRFLFTSAETTVFNLTDAEIDEKYFNVWLKVCEGMDLNFLFDGDNTEVLTMDGETFKIYQEIDSEYCNIQNSESESQDIKNYLSKMKTYVPRFALLFSIIDAIGNDGYIEILPIHMTKAKKVSNYFIRTARNVFNANNEVLDIKEVESSLKGLKRADKIISLLEKGFKKSEVAKYYGVSRQTIYKIIENKN